MMHVQYIVLGQPPKDPDEGDERVTNLMQILERGYPDGILALCRKCHACQEIGLDEAALMIVDHNWPQCHGKRMDMIDPEHAPRY